MPKKYRRISQQQLELGVFYVQQQHLSIRKAAQLSNVSKSSLHRKIMEIQHQNAEHDSKSTISADSPCISYNKQSDDSSECSIFSDMCDFVALQSESMFLSDF